MLLAELRAILSALQFDEAKGSKYSATTVSLITKWMSSFSSLCFYCALVNQLLHKDWTIRAYRIYREANRVADNLAKLGHSLSFGLHTFNSPPHECTTLLWHDIEGVYFPRKVLVYILALGLHCSKKIENINNIAK